eukprot:scaffold574_cov333-Pavlova_lutheri.AAC.48
MQVEEGDMSSLYMEDAVVPQPPGWLAHGLHLYIRPLDVTILFDVECTTFFSPCSSTCSVSCDLSFQARILSPRTVHVLPTARLIVPTGQTCFHRGSARPTKYPFRCAMCLVSCPARAAHTSAGHGRPRPTVSTMSILL